MSVNNSGILGNFICGDTINVKVFGHVCLFLELEGVLQFVTCEPRRFAKGTVLSNVPSLGNMWWRRSAGHGGFKVEQKDKKTQRALMAPPPPFSHGKYN